MTCFSWPCRACWTCAPGITANGGTVVVISSSPRCLWGVGHAHRGGHRDEHFAWSAVGLPAVRAADVVDEHQVARLPWLTCGVGLVDLVQQLHDVVAYRVAVAEAGVE